MSGYIGTQPVPQATQTRDAFTATNNQTSFPTSGYTPEFLDVFLNGVKLAAADYTATNGSDVVLAAGATTGDILEVVSYGTFEVLNPTFDGNVTFTGNASFGDNDKAIFGDGNDLQIYHDGSSSYISDVGTGNLRIKSNGVATQILDGSSLNLAVFNSGNGQAQLYNVNSGTSTIRLATTSTGIDVTGKARATDTSANAVTYAIVTDNSGASGTTVAGLGFANGGALKSSITSAVYGNDYMTFNVGGSGTTERMRIDSSGNVLVGKTSAGYNVDGFEAHPNGETYVSRSGTPMAINRNSSDGTLLNFYKDGTGVGSIGTHDTRLAIGSDDTYIMFDSGNTPAIWPSSGSAGTDGIMGIGDASRRFKDLYLSGGVYLGGTGSANKLDDYEEGTFTVGFEGATVSATNTTALYTKIGDLVTWYWYSGGTDISSSSGVAKLTGLPFTVFNSNNNYNPVSVAHNTFFGGSTSIGQQAYHLVGNSRVVFNTIGQGNNASFVNASNVAIMLHGSYKTAS